MKFSSFRSRADGDLGVRTTRNDHVAVGVENVVGDFGRIGLSSGGSRGVDRVFGPHGNLRAGGHNVGFGTDFGLSRVVVMFVYRVGRGSRRRAARWRGSISGASSRR